MGKLISVVGNCGVGKTTLSRLLGNKYSLITGLEEHSERPFQELFRQDPSFAFANQIDYMMMRFEQEYLIRSGDRIGITDGGLEMDFHIFSRLFQQKGWLSDSQFSLLERIYQNLRRLLPPPELFVFLHTKPEIIAERFRQRGRPLEIATISDLEMINSLLEDWLTCLPQEKLISINASDNDPEYRLTIPALSKRIADLNDVVINDKK